MDMRTKMVAKFSSYLWLGPILYTGKWQIFWELWKAVISRITENKTNRSAQESPNRESSVLGTKMLWSEKAALSNLSSKPDVTNVAAWSVPY